MNIIEWIDTSTVLDNLVSPIYDYDYIESIESNVTHICLPDRTCRGMDCIIFDFSRFILLEELIIGDECFSNVNIFDIDGLSELKLIKIGKNSFTKEKNGWGYDSSQSFSIFNCDQLESIEIGSGSFSDYRDLFALVNLPKLSIIKIGEIGSKSSNFYSCSFDIRGKIYIMIMNRSSKFAIDWIRW